MVRELVNIFWTYDRWLDSTVREYQTYSVTLNPKGGGLSPSIGAPLHNFSVAFRQIAPIGTNF